MKVPKNLSQAWDLVVFTFYWFYSPYEASEWLSKKWETPAKK